MQTNLRPSPPESRWDQLLCWLQSWLLPPSLTQLPSPPPLPRAAEPTEELEALLPGTDPLLGQAEERIGGVPCLRERALPSPAPIPVHPDAATVLNLPAAAFNTLVPSALDWGEEEPPLEMKTRRLKG